MLADVYRTHNHSLHRYVRSIVRDPTEAEDVVQGVMVKALVALREAPHDFEIRPWLYRVAHNEAISVLRTRDRRPATELHETVAMTGPSVSDLVADRRRMDQLLGDIAALPERQRQALILRELNGLSHDEIGRVLGIGAHAVKQAIFEGRTGLLRFAEGRELRCVTVQQKLSDGDGRVRRGRQLRAHLRSCDACRAFDVALTERPRHLAACAPLLPGLGLPVGHVVAGQAAVAGGSAGSVGALGLGGSVGAAVATKAAAIVVAVVAAAGVSSVGYRLTTADQPSSADAANDAAFVRPANSLGLGLDHSRALGAPTPFVDPAAGAGPGVPGESPSHTASTVPALGGFAPASDPSAGGPSGPSAPGASAGPAGGEDDAPATGAGGHGDDSGRTDSAPPSKDDAADQSPGTADGSSPTHRGPSGGGDAAAGDIVTTTDGAAAGGNGHGNGAANSNAGGNGNGNGNGAANSNAGGNGNGNGNGAANSNAGGNGNGNSAANSNSGGNGNGAANSNAGGNGNGAANSNAGGNGNGAANSNAGGNGNGNSAANSNSGGNGNGAANSNAGGNGHGNGAANSNSGGNGAANSNAGGNGSGGPHSGAK